MPTTLTFPAAPVTVANVNIAKRGPVPVPLRWQTWHDSWRNTDRSLRWYGACIVCARNVWAFDDGENDPRGVLGDNALWTIHPDEGTPGTTPETIETGPQVRACAICANDYDAYKTAKRIARRTGMPDAAPLTWPNSR